MNYNNLIVITEDGLRCTFFEDPNGTPKVTCFNGKRLFENRLADNGVVELKRGRPLQFDYYAGIGIEEFVSESPVVSIKQIK